MLLGTRAKCNGAPCRAKRKLADPAGFVCSWNVPMRKRLFETLVCRILLATASFFCSRAGAADQPQWGQVWSRNMVSEEKNLPDSFDPKTGRNIKWSAQLGNETHSTPVVAGGRVYIGTNNGEPRDPKHQGDRGILMCFDEKNGQFL